MPTPIKTFDTPKPLKIDYRINVPGVGEVDPTTVETADQIQQRNLEARKPQFLKDFSAATTTIDTTPKTIDPTAPEKTDDTASQVASWRKAMEDAIKENDARMAELKAEQERDSKSEMSRRRIADVADALSSFANLYGVSRGGYNSAKEPPIAGNVIDQRITADQRLRDTRMQNLLRDRQQTLNSLLSGIYKGETAEHNKALDVYHNRRETRLEKQQEIRADENARRGANNEKKTDATIEHWNNQDKMRDREIALKEKKAYGAGAATSQKQQREEERQADREEKKNEKATEKRIAELASPINWEDTKRSIAESYGARNVEDLKNIRPDVYNALFDADTEKERESIIRGLMGSNGAWSESNGLTRPSAPSEPEDGAQAKKSAPWKKQPAQQNGKAVPWKK